MRSTPSGTGSTAGPPPAPSSPTAVSGTIASDRPMALSTRVVGCAGRVAPLQRSRRFRSSLCALEEDGQWSEIARLAAFDHAPAGRVRSLHRGHEANEIWIGAPFLNFDGRARTSSSVNDSGSDRLVSPRDVGPDLAAGRPVRERPSPLPTTSRPSGWATADGGAGCYGSIWEKRSGRMDARSASTSSTKRA